MYDAIIVGARCAGSPTAMLLARKGYRVLLLEKSGFPSDTLSTHYIHQPGVARLARWGLLDAVVASNCPPIGSQLFDVGPFALRGTPPPADGIAHGYAPRRTVLDQILAEGAAAAGAELREHCTVDELITDNGRVTGVRGRDAGGVTFAEEARIVIGADGMRSMVARSVGAETYNAVPSLTCAYYTYWSDVPCDGVELYPRPGRMIIAGPTNDGATLNIVYWPHAAFHEFRSDVEGNFSKTLDLVPSLAERVRAGTRVEPIRGTGDLPNFFRRAHGPGWALVGDAGYHKDPILAQGISDSFRGAEMLADAIDDGFSERRPLADALATYERTRDEHAGPLYEMTCQLAKLEPPDADMQQLFGALLRDQEATNSFFGTFAGTVPIPEFFAPENIGRIMAKSPA